MKLAIATLLNSALIAETNAPLHREKAIALWQQAKANDSSSHLDKTLSKQGDDESREAALCERSAIELRRAVAVLDQDLKEWLEQFDQALSGILGREAEMNPEDYVDFYVSGLTPDQAAETLIRTAGDDE